MIEKTRNRIEINVICVRIWLVITTKITPEQSLGSKSQSASAITTSSILSSFTAKSCQTDLNGSQ